MSGKTLGKKDEAEKPDLISWLGFRRLGEWVFSMARPLGGFLGFVAVFTVLILAVVFFATLGIFTLAITGMIAPPPAYDMRAAGVLLAFLLGAPFVIWRTMVAAKQAETAAEALFNEKINAASAGLSARRQVTRVVGHGSHQRVLTEWEDDLVARNAAIDRLEGLVHENKDAANRVASLLSVYVVELSEEPENRPETPPESATPDVLRRWVWGLTRKRSDMERAAQVLGRLQWICGVQLEDGRIDLRRANLQGVDLHELDFSKARLSDAHLEGANLERAHLEGAVLWEAHLEGAEFQGAHLDERTSLMDASLRGAAVKDVDWSIAKITQEQINSMFGDASVRLPQGKARPAHWPNRELNSGEFDSALDNWRSDRTSYTPPQNRS